MKREEEGVGEGLLATRANWRLLALSVTTLFFAGELSLSSLLSGGRLGKVQALCGTLPMVNYCLRPLGFSLAALPLLRRLDLRRRCWPLPAHAGEELLPPLCLHLWAPVCLPLQPLCCVTGTCSYSHLAAAVATLWLCGVILGAGGRRMVGDGRSGCACAVSSQRALPGRPLPACRTFLAACLSFTCCIPSVEQGVASTDEAAGSCW